MSPVRLRQKTRSTPLQIARGDEKKFDFLLAVIDMLDTRKLMFDCNLYTALLFEGTQLGGLRKKIASLIAERRITSQSDSHQLKFDQLSTTKSDRVKKSWLELIDNYSDYKTQSENVDLPLIRLSINERDLRQVLGAERDVSYNNSRGKKMAGKSKRN